LRSATGGGATSAGAPHAGQNRAASGNVAPHWAQAAINVILNGPEELA
jgi:hypothetical protein